MASTADKGNLFKKMFGKLKDVPFPPFSPKEPAPAGFGDELTIQVPPRRGAPITTLSAVTPGRSLTASVLGRGPTGSVHSVYKIGKKLGAGQFGTVYICQEISTGQMYACKSISRSSLISEEDVADVRTEVSIMYRLQDQPHIVKLKSTFEDRNHIHIIMELCKGGELFNEINRRVANDDVPYRDLKPENFLLTTRHSDATLKASDFGLASFFKPGQHFVRVCGSAMYMAPEVIRLYNGRRGCKYGPPVDVWAAGIIIYIMLAGSHPFSPSKDRSEAGFMKSILRGCLSFSGPDWETISESAKDLIRSMLHPTPANRPTAEQVLAHPWLQNAPDAVLGREALRRFQQFIELVKLKKFKKAALRILSENLSEQTVLRIQGEIERGAATSSGTISLSSLTRVVGEVGNTETADALRGAAGEAGVDGDATMEYSDFLIAVRQLCEVEKQESLFKAFSLYDEDLTGYISQNEVTVACKKFHIHSVIMAELVAEGGRIDYNEFVTMMRKEAGGFSRRSIEDAMETGSIRGPVDLEVEDADNRMEDAENNMEGVPL